MYILLSQYSILETVLKYFDHHDLYAVCYVSKNCFRVFLRYWRELPAWYRYDSILKYLNKDNNHFTANRKDEYFFSYAQRSPFGFDFALSTRPCKSEESIFDLTIRSIKHAFHIPLPSKETGAFLDMSFKVIPLILISNLKYLQKSPLMKNRKNHNLLFCVYYFENLSVAVEFSNLTTITHFCYKYNTNGTKDENLMIEFCKLHNVHVIIPPKTFERPKYENRVNILLSNRYIYIVHFSSLSTFLIIDKYDGGKILQSYQLNFKCHVDQSCLYSFIQDKYFVQILPNNIVCFLMKKSSIESIGNFDRPSNFLLETYQVLTNGIVVFLTDDFEFTAIDVIKNRVHKHHLIDNSSLSYYRYNNISYITDVKKTMLFVWHQNGQIERVFLKWVEKSSKSVNKMNKQTSTE